MGPGRNENHEGNQGVVVVWSSCGPELTNSMCIYREKTLCYIVRPCC